MTKAEVLLQPNIHLRIKEVKKIIIGWYGDVIIIRTLNETPLLHIK